MPSTRIAVVGDNCIDVYVGEAPRSAVGGNALNVAVGLARLGIQTEYIGEVGDDDAGRRVVDALAGAEVRADRVHVVEGRTWAAFIVVEAGTARVIEEDPGACGPYTPWDGEFDLFAEFDHVHMANLAEPGVAVRQLRARGVSTSYDYGKADRGWAPGELPRIAFASCDDDGAYDRGVEMVRAACARGAELAVVTLGAAGSLAFDGQRIERQPAKAIQPVDTLGAGDSYIAAFLASHFRGSTLETAMNDASEAASRTCLHWAGWPQQALVASRRGTHP